MKFSSSPGARQDRRGLGLNGELCRAHSCVFLRGGAIATPLHLEACAASKPLPAMAGSWLDQKIRHGVELLQGLAGPAHDAAQRVLGDLELHAGFLCEPDIEPSSSAPPPVS